MKVTSHETDAIESSGKKVLKMKYVVIMTRCKINDTQQEDRKS